jgi:ribosome biogenesis GTPase
VVGDRVTVELGADHAVVTAVEARRNCLLRRSPRTRRAQILAANVDQALVVFAASRPQPKRGLLDRFLVACRHADISPIIVINKIDLSTAVIASWLEIYPPLGFPVIQASALDGRGIEAIAARLSVGTTLFCGPSGVGKSSILNAIHPGFRLKVGGISEVTGKGRHTTSRAELLALPDGGFVVDTPGLKEFGLWDATRPQLAAGFPEFAPLVRACRFPDCSHTHEPDCAVREAVEDGSVDRDRYASYVSMLEDLQLD